MRLATTTDQFVGAAFDRRQRGASSVSWRGDKYGHRTRSRCAARSLPAKRQPRKLRPLAARRRFCPRRSAPPAPKAHQPMAGPRVQRGAERSEHRAGVVVTRLSGTHATTPLPAGSRIGQAQWRRSLPKPAGQRDEQPRGGERRSASAGTARPESADARTRRRMDRRACASLYPGEFHRRVIYCWRATTHASQHLSARQARSGPIRQLCSGWSSARARGSGSALPQRCYRPPPIRGVSVWPQTLRRRDAARVIAITSAAPRRR